jgi:hypothetical protein
MELSGDFLLVGEDMGTGHAPPASSSTDTGGECTYAMMSQGQSVSNSSPLSPAGAKPKHPAQPQYCVVCFEREPNRAEVMPVNLIQPVCTVCYQRRVFFCSQMCLLSEAPQAVRRCHHCIQRRPRMHKHGFTDTVVASQQTQAGTCCGSCECNWLQRRFSRKLSYLRCAFCKAAGS